MVILFLLSLFISTFIYVDIVMLGMLIGSSNFVRHIILKPEM